MTNDEGITWLKRRSAVVVLHEGRMVVVIPKKQFIVDVEGEGRIDVLVRDGFTVALSDPGDSLGDVVEAARAAWLDKASPVDALGDSLPNHDSAPAKLIFRGDPMRFFPG